jgi:Winged helix DNA-binding domain
MRALWHIGLVDILWEQALAWRMRRHYLIERASPDDLVMVVDRLRGLHAQVMSSVDLALWARIDRLEQDAVADALWRQRTLVKMWAMRATLHVLPAADLGAWIAGLGIWKPGVWPLKQAEAIPLVGYIDRALRGKVLTRTELAAAVTKLGATPEMVEGMLGGWGGYLKRASFSGYLCLAPNGGQQARFTHPATWLRKRPVQLDNNKAFDVLTTRYLGTYGPATARDLGHWWGINQGQAKRRLAAIGDVATEVTIEGERYWMLIKDVADLAATEQVNVVRLLPAFDQWVVCASRRVPALLNPKYRQRIYRLQGWVSPVLLVNGHMAGVWKHEHKGRTVSVEIEPFAKLARWTRTHIAAEAERLASFVGGDLKLKIER